MVGDEVKRLAADVCGVDAAAIRDEARLLDYGMDSVRAVDFIVRLEETFGISISETEAAKLRTFRDVIRFVEGKLCLP